MKVTQRISRFVFDRRKHVSVGVAAIVLAIAGVAMAPDRDQDLVYVVSTAIDHGQQTFAQRIPFYRAAHVVLFDGETKTACGEGFTASGPFYCARDERIYIDLSFLRAIDNDLARSYVIFHELGHHAQQFSSAPKGIAAELQADCYAGQLIAAEQLDAGDVEAALELAAQIGDDRLMPGSSRESWRHGSSDERVRAVTTGIAGGSCR